jgi:glycine/D-amino acid oxidase-like deaminating enzyme
MKNHYSIFPLRVEGQQMLLIGGEGGNLPLLKLSKKKRYEKLSSYAKKHFGVTTITHTWADRDYRAYDKVPLIGKAYPWSRHLYTATAFKKWGLSNGTVAGLVLHDLITDRPNPWARHFRPQRLKPITSIPRAVREYLSN